MPFYVDSLEEEVCRTRRHREATSNGDEEEDTRDRITEKDNFGKQWEMETMWEIPGRTSSFETIIRIRRRGVYIYVYMSLC